MKDISSVFEMINKPILIKSLGDKSCNDIGRIPYLKKMILENVNKDNVNFKDPIGNNLAIKLMSFLLEEVSFDQFTEDSNNDVILCLGKKNASIDPELASIFDYLIDECHIDLTQENNKGFCFYQGSYSFEIYSLLTYIFNKNPNQFNEVFHSKRIPYKHARNNYMLQFLIDKVPDLDLSTPELYNHDFFKRMIEAPSKKTKFISHKEIFEGLLKKQKVYRSISEAYYG